MRRLLKSIYIFIPGKMAFFTMIRDLFHPGRSVYKHLHFHGAITIEVPDQQVSFSMNHFGYALENALFWEGMKGFSEHYSVAMWAKLCRMKQSIIDGGANTGLYSLVAAAMNPKAEIHAFEPVERICDRLSKNVALNSFNIRSIPKALSDYTGDGYYFDTMTEHLYSITVNENKHVEGLRAEKKPLQTITLDQYALDLSLKNIDLIKLDIEQHEVQALKGAAIVIKEYRPDMLIEVLTDESAQALALLLAPYDYLYYDMDEVSEPRLLNKIVKSSFRNIWALKKESAELLGLETNASA